MEIEQKLPKSPNFGIVVGLFCATLLIFFVLALFFIRFDGKHLTFRHHSSHPTSQLVAPRRLRPAKPARLIAAYFVSPP